jgi:C2 domain
MGLMQFTLFEARGLRSIDPMGQQDPYVQIALGKNYIKRSKSIKKGGTQPYYAEEEMLVWVDSKNWVDPMQISMFDEEIGPSKLIGGTTLSVLKYCNPAMQGLQEETFQLFYKKQMDPKDRMSLKDVPQGELIMKVRTYPSVSYLLVRMY